MAECSFKFNIDSNPTEIINNVKLKKPGTLVIV